MNTKITYQTVVENLCNDIKVSINDFSTDNAAQADNPHLREDEQVRDARKAVALKLQKLSIDILETI
jgi:hypothetical protein